MMQSKADLHVHTKYSDRPSEWFLRRVGAPESFTEPIDVYRRCKAKGMDFVTISDHNRIEGALENPAAWLLLQTAHPGILRTAGQVGFVLVAKRWDGERVPSAGRRITKARFKFPTNAFDPYDVHFRDY